MKNPLLAPVLLFAYKRLDTVTKTVSALKENFLAKDTELFVFSDGSKSNGDVEKVELVRDYLDKIEGFKKVHINKAETNNGLANSIMQGVSEVLRSHKSCIVLEDDLLTSANFLNFMNEALNTYESNEQVFSISGFTFPIQRHGYYQFDAYFHPRGCSWGWATWANRWKAIDWKLLDTKKEQRNISQTKTLGTDFPSLVKKYQKRAIDSWAVPWSYYQYKKGMLTLYPMVSKVKNIGFDLDATHTLKTGERFSTDLDTTLSTKFSFSSEAVIDEKVSQQYTNKFSYFERIKGRLAYDIKKLLRI